MAGQTKALMEADNALKDDYLPTVREQLNHASVTLSQIESGSISVEGLNAVLSLHVGRNSGIGARAEGGTLPTAGRQRWIEERVSLYHNYGRIQLSGQVFAATKSDKGSWVRALAAETEGLTTDLRRDVNRQLFGDGSGVIADCGVTTADTEVVLDTPSIVQIRQLEVGMFVDIVDQSASASAQVNITNGTNREIIAVNRTTGTITLDAAGGNVTTTVDEAIVRNGNYGVVGTYQREVTGLSRIVDDTLVLHGIDPASEDSWKSTVNGNSGTARDADDVLFENVIEDIAIEGGTPPDFIVSPHGVRRNYAAQLKLDRRFMDTTSLKGGFEALTVSADHTTLAFAVDRDAPFDVGADDSGIAWILNTGCLYQHESSGWDWMDRDGSVLNRVANSDAYEATLFKYHEVATDKRNAHGKIEDLNVS